jgi:hypothetical protein
MVKADDWSEEIFTTFTDGSYMVENYWYHDEDWYDYDYEQRMYSVDGVETYYEYTDSNGNTNSQAWDETGNEYYGQWCDPSDDELAAGEYQYCEESGMDAEGNTWVSSWDTDGMQCDELFYWDGSYQDCDGNHISVDGLMITD